MRHIGAVPEAQWQPPTIRWQTIGTARGGRLDAGDPTADCARPCDCVVSGATLIRRLRHVAGRARLPGQAPADPPPLGQAGVVVLHPPDSLAQLPYDGCPILSQAELGALCRHRTSTAARQSDRLHGIADINLTSARVKTICPSIKTVSQFRPSPLDRPVGCWEEYIQIKQEPAVRGKMYDSRRVHTGKSRARGISDTLKDG